MVEAEGLDHPFAHSGRHNIANPRGGGEYDYYMEDVAVGGPRVTSSRQQALQKSRMSKSKNGMPMSKSRGGGGMGARDRYAQGNYVIHDPSMDMMRGPDHERSGSFSSLLNGSYMPGDGGDGGDGEDGDGFLNEDDDLGPHGRARSDTLLSISSVGLAGLGESLGLPLMGGHGKKGKQIGRSRVGSEEWDLAASGYASLLNGDELPFTSFPGMDAEDRRPSIDQSSGAGNANGAPGAKQSNSQGERSGGLGEDASDAASGSGSLANPNPHPNPNPRAADEDAPEPREKRMRRDTMEMLHNAFM
jgi:hypothetical protein